MNEQTYHLHLPQENIIPPWYRSMNACKESYTCFHHTKKETHRSIGKYCDILLLFRYHDSKSELAY